MKRTPQQRARRRNLAEAACDGGPAKGPAGIGRVKVAVYACLPESDDPSKVLPALRAYALARDWDVIAELVDRVPVTTLAAEREHWPRVAELIESGQAGGIVTPMRRMCGYRPGEESLLDAWLVEHQAFLAHTWPASRAAEVRF